MTSDSCLHSQGDKLENEQEVPTEILRSQWISNVWEVRIDSAVYFFVPFQGKQVNISSTWRSKS